MPIKKISGKAQLRTVKVSLSREQILNIHLNPIDLLPFLPANQFYSLQNINTFWQGVNNYDFNAPGYPYLKIYYSDGVRPLHLSVFISYVSMANGISSLNGGFSAPKDDADFIIDVTTGGVEHVDIPIFGKKLILTTNFYYDENDEQIKAAPMVDKGGSGGVDFIMTYLVYDTNGNIIGV